MSTMTTSFNCFT